MSEVCFIGKLSPPIIETLNKTDEIKLVPQLLPGDVTSQ